MGSSKVSAQAIRIHAFGGPEVMQLEDIELPPPAPGQARVRQHAIGLNYIDIYHRTGLYPVPLPSGLGMEGAGVIEAIGEGVSVVAVGDRVAYAGGDVGAYCNVRNMSADKLVCLPDSISFDVAAAVMLQGLTTQYLLRRTYRVQAGDTILIHAAAGGVGLLACQWAKALGATVIGTVSTDEKAQLAREHGCDHPILYTRENFAEAVRKLTDGRGVHVVYDSIGKDTFMDSLSCLRPLGMMVSFGNASGPVPPIEPAILAKMGSLFLTRPTLAHYAATRVELLTMTKELFEMIHTGLSGRAIRVNIQQRYPLSDVVRAHTDLSERRTTGSTILIP